MFGIGHFKGDPSKHTIRYSAGKVVAQGPGLSFFYMRYNTQVAAVPTNSADSNFVFNESTNNFQSVTIQGQFTYRITNPTLIAGLLNFTIHPETKAYLSNDPEKLTQRISNIIQIETRGEIQTRSLEQTLRDSQLMAAAVLQRAKNSPELQGLGVELLSVYILAAKPSSEVAKALEAEYRETLLRKADEAIYARRASAVEEERKIKEKELATDRALAEQRRELIILEGENTRQEAESRGRAAQLEAEYLAKAGEINAHAASKAREIQAQAESLALEIEAGGRSKAMTLEAESRLRALEQELTAYKLLDPKLVLSLGMKGIGDNAGKIGNLTVTTELLAGILNDLGKNN